MIEPSKLEEANREIAALGATVARQTGQEPAKASKPIATPARRLHIVSMADVVPNPTEWMLIDVVKGKLQAIKTDRKAAAARLDAITQAIPAGEQRCVDIASFDVPLEHARQSFQTFGFDELRLAVEALVEGVTAGKDRATWQMNLTLPFLADGVLFPTSTTWSRLGATT